MTDLPEVDVVIPTLNAAPLLEESLLGIRKQDYSGRTRVIVVDGGSTDGTQDVAARFHAEIHEKPGMYSTGLTGARNYGLGLATGELHWQLDADNFVVEETALSDLVKPFLQDPNLHVTFPEVLPNPGFHPICNWMALEERAVTSRLASTGRQMSGWILIPNLTFGLCNGSLLRTETIRKVGGYDSDVRVLDRMRRSGLSRAAYVPTSHYYHKTVSGPSALVSKLCSRILRFGQMRTEDLDAYFASDGSEGYPAWVRDLLTVAGAPLRAVRHLSKGEDRAWAWGFAYPALVGYATLRNPLQSLRTLHGFL